MDSQQAAQQEALMEVKVEAGGGSPARRQGCSRCVMTLTAVMGLIILTLTVGISLQVFMLTPSCTQKALPLSATGKVYLSTKLKVSNEEGRFDIFTVDKAARYLIYGWVKLSVVSREEVVLLQTVGEKNSTIQKRNANDTEIFFCKKVLMVDGTKISIDFNSAHTDSLFYLYEL